MSERMRGLSLWQPWASLMAIGVKQNETRGHFTHVRGELVICAAQRKPRMSELSQELMTIIWRERYNLTDHTKEGWSSIESLVNLLPRGDALCKVNLFNCYATEHFDLNSPVIAGVNREDSEEIASGDYSEGRYAWMTRDLRRLRKPVPVKGKQGFFWIDEATSEKIRRQI